MNEEGKEFVRFTLGRRVEHLVLLLTFALLVVTGIPQKFHNAAWAERLITAMGGVEFARNIHRVSAILLGLAALYHLVDGLYRLLVKREPFAMLPRQKDIRDLIDTLKYFFGLAKGPSQFDRFDFRQKFEYWAVVWGLTIMGGSGFILWFPVPAARFLPGWMIPVAKAAHSGEALLALLAIVVWHLYNAHLNPTTFLIDISMGLSMITGKISERRLREEHPLEYASLMKAAPEEAPAAGPEVSRVPPAEPEVSWTAIVLSGVTGLVILSILGVLLWAGLRAEVPYP